MSKPKKETVEINCRCKDVSIAIRTMISCIVNFGVVLWSQKR